MLSAQQSLVFLLAFITSCLGLPFNRRQTNVTSLASCAPAAIQIDQFGTFSGNADLLPYVTFYVLNSNLGAPEKMLCTATFPSDGGSFNNTDTYYSCEQPNSGFNWQEPSGILKVFQYQVCASGIVNTATRQVIISAQGNIATISYPGENGGTYTESITGSINIPVDNVQDVTKLSRGTDRAAGGQNVTCGLIGPFNVVYPLGPCDIGTSAPEEKA